MSETVYIIGDSRTQTENSITRIYSSFYIAFEVEVETDRIVDVGCTHTVDLTESFIRRMLVNEKFLDTDRINDQIMRRYHGSSQKAILVAYKDAVKKYLMVKEKFY